MKGHILISLSCTYMNTPDAKAGGKGKGWETALAVSLCQLCLGRCPNPGTAAFQPTASTAGTCHQRGAIWNVLGWKECPVITQPSTNGIHCRLLLGCCSERWEAPCWRYPLLAANSTSARIHSGSSANRWGSPERCFVGQLLVSTLRCTDQEFVTLRMPELKRSLQREPKNGESPFQNL